ncbi:hypothetical protein DCAR_0205919 [Daucus carota subsp. sativus]|uniref:RNA polymerase II subunit B1 CTD phosphatase RPAP2 homolog n=1 Tax=Daucus carota subsp. sativus TaxID=79200 RepID=A0AAF1ANK1_DAUCS|nr:hypothetical protein DCAR_0205919 [Daucus carota subsp. sativus]
MANKALVSVADTIYELQKHLLDGIQTDTQLHAAGSLMSKNDYKHVVTERSIAKSCGYPLCPNDLSCNHVKSKGKYHISLREHRVYDLEEMRMYCSMKCLVESKAFLGTLQEERSTVLDVSKIEEIMGVFGVRGNDGVGNKRRLRVEGLTIRENEEVAIGEVVVGDANAIEGYVPKGSRGLDGKNQKQVIKPSKKKPAEKNDLNFSEFDFMSTIITQDEYSVFKVSSQLLAAGSGSNVNSSGSKVRFEEMNDQFAALGMSSDHASSSSKTKFEEPNQDGDVVDMIDNLSISSGCQGGPGVNVIEARKGALSGKTDERNVGMLKPSLKSLSSKNVTRSVTWADEKSAGNRRLFEGSELEDTKQDSEGLNRTNMEENDSLRLASAEACAVALSQAAEAVASGDSDVPDAVSEAGIIVMPPPTYDERRDADMDTDMEPAAIKWPQKQGITASDFFDNSEDSWYDDAPEGFNLILSPFASMFMSLFSWISSSSLAYIYGRDESSHEEYLSVNGREYPRRVMAIDNRSSEIKLAVAGCLSRTFPELVNDLRLPVPVSTLEKGMSYLLDTMSFMDPVPPFSTKQWHVIIFLFLDALSVSRVPSIAPYIKSKRKLLQKVLDGAKISEEEYGLLKDLVLPLGRVPYFSAQSGG